MKQTKDFIKHRDRVKNYVSFVKMFGRTKNGKRLSTNLYGKLQGHVINDSPNQHLNDAQVKVLKDRLTDLRDSIDEWLDYIKNAEKDES